MSFEIDPTRDALVIADVQNDFCPGGALGVPDGDAVVPVLSRYAARFAAAGAPVFVTRDWHPERTKHFKAWGGLWPPHCVQGTRGAEFHEGLRLPASAELVSKGIDPEADGYSAFEAEARAGRLLGDLLAERGVRRLFVGGLATDYCVKATVLEALRRGLDVVVLEDGVRAVDLVPGDGARAIEQMRSAGARFTTGEAVAA